MSRRRRRICSRWDRPQSTCFRVELARGPAWYAKYRLPDGRRVQKKLGPAWTERARPVAKRSCVVASTDNSCVAKGVARSESTQMVKAIAREPPGAAGLRLHRSRRRAVLCSATGRAAGLKVGRQPPASRRTSGCEYPTVRAGAVFRRPQLQLASPVFSSPERVRPICRRPGHRRVSDLHRGRRR